MRRALLVFVALVTVPRAAWAQGNPIGPEFRVNTFTTAYQGYPSVAATAGNFVVVWGSNLRDGSSRGVFGQRYDASGVPLGSEFRVNTYTTNDQRLPSVAADTAGNFIVVWISQDGSSYGVFGQRYANTGTPLGPEFLVNTYTTGYQGVPSVAKDPDPGGNFLVVWRSLQDGSSSGVFGQRYSSSGFPLGAEFRVNSYTTDAQARPAIAANVTGGFVVVWDSYAQDGSGYGVFGQRYSGSGAPLGPEFRVNTYTTGGQTNPSIASGFLGDFVVVWDSFGQDGSSDGVFGQRYASSGAPLGPEFRVNTFAPGVQREPSVASDSSGNFVVAWTSFQDGSYGGIFGQRYASSGGPLGSEFRVNTYTTSFQELPSVAADSAGNFVVAWTSYLQDGSGTGVFGQRYGQIVPVELMHFRIE